MRRRGRPPHPDVLTPREWEVLALVREGMTNDEIAQRLRISVRGVKFHVSEIIGKLGVSDRHEAARWSGGGDSSPAVALASPFRRTTWPMLPGAISSTAIAVSVAAVALLAWGVFASRERITKNSGTNVSAPGAESSEPAPVGFDVMARAVQEYDILYYYEPVSTFGRLYMQRVDAASHATIERQTQISDVTAAGVLSTNSAAMLTEPKFFTTERIPLDPVRPVPTTGHITLRGFDGQLPEDLGDGGPKGGELTAVSVDGVDFWRDGDAIVRRDRAGYSVAAYPVPEARAATDDDFLIDGRPTKGIPMVHSFLRELLATPRNDVLAIVSNAGNSAIVDLMSGERTELVGYTNVVAATIAKDGYIYAAIWDTHWSVNELQIAKIDPESMTLVAQQSTGIQPRFTPIDGQAMLATPDGGVSLYLQLSGGESRLYRVDAATASATLIATPRELGLDAVVGVDGKIYFAQGYGQNRVSLFDPSTNAFDVDVPWLRAPAGSYVVGFVAR